MTELVFLSDPSQVRVVLAWPRGRLNESRFVTGSLTVAGQLEEHGLQIIDELSLLTPAEMAKNMLLAPELAGTWWRDSWGDSDYLGLSMATMAKQEWALPCELVLNAGMIYERLLGSREYRSITGFFQPPIAMCRTGPAPAFQPARAITNAVMRWHAQKLGIPVTGLTTRSPHSAEGRQWRPRVNAIDLVPSSRQTPWSSRPGDRENTVLLWRNGLWKEEISAIQRLSDVEGWRLVTLSAREVSAVTPADNESEFSAFAEKLNRARRALLAERDRYAGPYPELYRNAFLNFQFDRIFSELKTAAFLGSRFSSVIDTLEPRLLILGHDAFTIERTIVEVARNKETPSVALLHGGLQPAFGRLGIAGDAQKILVWGPDDVRSLPQVGIASERILEVGSIRFEQAYAESSETLSALVPGTVPVRLAPEPLSGARLPLSVVFLTAPPNVDLSQASASPALHRRTWNALIPMIRRRRDWRFMIRPHPAYDFIDFYRNLGRKAGENLVLSQGGSLESVLQTCDVAVLVNYCTTSAVVAALAGVPVIFLRSAMYETSMHADPLQLHGAINVQTPEELEATVVRLSQDNQYRTQTLLDAQVMLELILGKRGESALTRLQRELRDILATAVTRSATEPSAVRPAGVREIIEKWTNNYHSAAVADLHVLVGSESGDRRGLGLAMSFAARSPAELRAWSKTLRQLAADRGESERHAVGGLILQCYLLCVIRAVDSRHWSDARILARNALADFPKECLRSTAFLKECGKTVVGGSVTGHALINSIDWLNSVLSRWQPAKYLRGSKLREHPVVTG